jgi:hypothetical protein
MVWQLYLGYEPAYKEPAQSNPEHIALNIEAKNTRDNNIIISRSKALNKNKRVTFANQFIHGSINLEGGRIDDLIN